jgi:hypothetical protein
MGLVVFAVMGLYLLISVLVVAGAVRYARTNRKSPARWGWSAALVMYLIPFWDWIPTVAMHRNYCEKEAGFWVYKTPEQWKKENPGVMETLVANKGWPSRREERDGGHEMLVTQLYNERFNVIETKKDVSWLLPIIRVEESLIDVSTKEALGRLVVFGTGNSVKNTIGPPGPLKYWLHAPYCPSGPEMEINGRKWMQQFRGVER